MRVALPFRAKAHSELLLQPLRVMLWILKLTMEALHFRQSEMWLRKWTCNLFICDSSTLPSTMVWELEWSKVDKNPALNRVFKFHHPRILKERLKQSGIVIFKGQRPYHIEHTEVKHKINIHKYIFGMRLFHYCCSEKYNVTFATYFNQ